ncbi:MAG TPA: hypothetical protein VL967_16120 [Terracidiphilus sp.]|nr:hypothetical protein [Terracidiphilus sp.]
MWDDELLNLAGDFSALTEMAQRVLRDELKTRGLDGAQPRDASVHPDRSSIPQHDFDEDLSQAEDSIDDGGPQHEFTWKTLLCDCDTGEEAWQISELLRRMGIESWIEAPGSTSVEMSRPRVLVAADELDRARQIASQPIPQDIVEESKLKLPEFEPPKCPRCGDDDPVLESTDPANSWTCEACGNQWTDPID